MAKLSLLMRPEARLPLSPLAPVSCYTLSR